MDQGIKEFDMNAVARGEPLTEWSNDTADVVRVIVGVPKKVLTRSRETGQVTEIETNEQRAFTWQPGEAKQIPSIYDRTIQLVDCGRSECHNRYGGGHYCSAGHEGKIVGGLAPLLTRQHQKGELDPCLTAHLHPSAPPSMAETPVPGSAAADPGESALARARARRGAR